MKRYYNIVGTAICIKGNANELYKEERRLAEFLIEEKIPSHTYKFSIVDNLKESSGICIYAGLARRVYQDGRKKIHYMGVVKKNLKGAYIRCEFDEKETLVQVKKEEVRNFITTKTVLNAIGIEGLALENHAVILHASFINANGRAILFTAPSGMGKSTQAELWKQYRDADIINGDRVAVKIEGSTVKAYGIPFSGSSEYCKKAELPVEAIVYLGKNKETSIKLLKGMSAFKKIWDEITIPVWEEKAVERISEMLITMLANVPVYYLQCTPDESAVIALENELRKE